MTKEQLETKLYLEGKGWKHTQSWLQETRLMLTMERGGKVIWVDQDAWIKYLDPDSPGHTLAEPVEMWIDNQNATI